MIIYKITNKLNGKYYIGKDAKNNPNYLGSGKNIKRAIKKYGKENFIKSILCYCNSIDEMNLTESEYITRDVVNDPNCYNIALGGFGGNTFYGMSKDQLDNIKKKISKGCSGEKNGMYGKSAVKGRIRDKDELLRTSLSNPNRQVILNETTGESYHSIREAGRMLNVNHQKIQRYITKGKLINGYKLSYENMV